MIWDLSDIKGDFAEKMSALQFAAQFWDFIRFPCAIFLLEHVVEPSEIQNIL